jgi:hypothetical protein
MNVIIAKKPAHQVMLDLLRVVGSLAVGGGADPDGRSGRHVGDHVRVLAEVDVAAVVALLADHLRRIRGFFVLS